MQTHGRKHRQVQHGNPGALQHQRIVVVAMTQPPAQTEQAQRRHCHTGVTQLNRHHHAFGGITQQKRQTEEQQHHADPQHGVASEQPVACAADGPFDEIWAARSDGLLRLAGDWLGFPDIVGQGTTGLRRRRGDRFEFGGKLPDHLRSRDRDFFENEYRRGAGVAGNRFLGNRLAGFGCLDARHLQQGQALLDRMQRYLRLFQQKALFRRLCAQTTDANGLADPQPEQRAQQRVAERLVEYPAQHQPNQHEHPLHGRYP